MIEAFWRMQVKSALGQDSLGQVGPVISAWFEGILFGPMLFI